VEVITRYDSQTPAKYGNKWARPRSGTDTIPVPSQGRRYPTR